MGKIAFVFPGQGAQYPGMGRELFEISPAARKLFEAAEAVRPGTMKQCFEGTKEELTETKNTQPCLFLADLAAARALTEKGVAADMAAGFSLGEVAALVFTGAVSHEDGFKLVCERGLLMQEASEAGDTSMAAVMKLESVRVEELCGAYGGVYPVNYNCPGQITVAGLKSELAAFGRDVKAAGGRALPLAVSGAFHSPFMKKAAAGLGEVLENISLKTPKMPLYSNYTAKPYGENARELLVKQVQNPVRWQETIENMIKAGADTFIEVGPGKTLSGLIKKISPDVRVLHVEDAESLEKTVSEVKGDA